MGEIGKIFVFGSNLAGRHGKGAALYAKRHYGAIQGKGYGQQGQSYAIPTKGFNLNVLSLDIIQNGVNQFLEFAKLNIGNCEFFVTKIGCGLAGYKEEQIRLMFKDAPLNCELPEGWR